jgi:hypothetical protein
MLVPPVAANTAALCCTIAHVLGRTPVPQATISIDDKLPIAPDLCKGAGLEARVSTVALAPQKESNNRHNECLTWTTDKPPGV